MAATEHSPFCGHSSSGSYSIKKEFDGATVMVTGVSGYIGSLVVELLLRTTNVKAILVLMRGKRGSTAAERLRHLLYSGLFHLVRDDTALLSKVRVLEGDMAQESLGLSAADQALVRGSVNVVIHCAASIELEADVQHTLRANYLGTRRLLDLAQSCSALRAFVHVSTAYVNVNLPPHSAIDEIFYPLKLGHQIVDPEQIVTDLMSQTPDTANVRAQMYLDMWGFPNTYTMGKHLTETMVSQYYRSGVPIAILRPSLVTGLSGAPYPGYCGNLAGPVGMGVAQAIGLFDSLGSIAMMPSHVWDAVPGDLVACAIIATAAATAAGVGLDFYKATPGQEGKPLIVHAATSTTYPISFIEAQWYSYEFIKHNPPPFCLPGTRNYKVPLDFKPDDAAVERAKWWTGWKVAFAVRVLTMLGQHKTARRLKYGYMAWAIQNSSKTDRNVMFGTRNLQALEARLEPAEADEYLLTWTPAHGGWMRYTYTNLAGLYRIVFGLKEIKGVQHDFTFIPAVTPPPLEGVGAEESAEGAEAVGEEEAEEERERDVFEAASQSVAASLATVPADVSAHGLLPAASTPRVVASTLSLKREHSGQLASAAVDADSNRDAVGIRHDIAAAIAKRFTTRVSPTPHPATSSHT